MRFVRQATFPSRHLRWLVGLAGIAGLLTATGCARWHQPPPPPLENPLAIPAPQCDAAWDQIVDVVDDYFDILSEQRVRQAGDVLTVGRIDTVPRTSATLLEPWREDAVNAYERLHGTLQTIRRRAVVQVIPAGTVFQVEAIVYKELEDLPTAEFSTAGQATFRPDDGLVRLEEPVGVQSVTVGWIGLGRDTALEQEILAKIMARVGPPQVSGFFPTWVQPWTSALPAIEVVPSPTLEQVPSEPLPGTTIP